LLGALRDEWRDSAEKKFRCVLWSGRFSARLRCSQPRRLSHRAALPRREARFLARSLGVRGGRQRRAPWRERGSPASSSVGGACHPWGAQGAFGRELAEDCEAVPVCV
ncbi:unnamed protein product, partial [Ixodes persulcatus]